MTITGLNNTIASHTEKPSSGTAMLSKRKQMTAWQAYYAGKRGKGGPAYA